MWQLHNSNIWKEELERLEKYHGLAKVSMKTT